MIRTRYYLLSIIVLLAYAFYTMPHFGAHQLEVQGSSNEKILLTGGAGFIGSHVAEALLDRGDRVIIVDNLSDYYDPELKRRNLENIAHQDKNHHVCFYRTDITDLESLRAIFENEQPTIVCHLAACAGISPSIKDPELYIKNNILGTFNLLEMTRTFGIKHFVFASSSSVYGASNKIPFEECDIVDKPCSPYAATKRACELLAYTYHHLYRFSCNGLRFFTVYGPRGRPDMAPFKFMDAIYKGVPINQHGDGSSMRDYTYIDDIVDGVVKAIDHRFSFEIFNLGRGEPVSLKDFVKLIEMVVHKDAHIIEIENQAGDVYATHASINKAKVMLGFEPKISLYEGIKCMYQWYANEYICGKK